MEVPMINRIRDFEVGINSINEPSFLSRSVAVSGIGKLHQAYGFWKWGALIIAFLAYFTNFITRLNSLVVRLRRKIDVSISSPTLFDDYDSDYSDVSCPSSASSDDEDEEDEEDKDEEDVDSIYDRGWVNGSFRARGSAQGQNDNFACFKGSFGDLFTWPDLGGGVVNLWDHLDINGGEEEGDGENVVASFLRNCGGSFSSAASPSSFFLTAERRGGDAVKVEACDPRAGFRMPALLAEWRQPGRFLGNVIGVEVGGVEKIYVRDDVSGKIAVGDLRRFNGALTDLTDADGCDTWWDADVVIGG
ncbi:Uncharacterized protein Rs2_39588 [Raphanus sativus]|uniref:Uncharacterized protein LOC108824410 n=1 Tax=Raphanus sativus TaxID=3726 RepID=A0A6J0L101_RAPSA|nr:uncharacterized protein LOC108824410 [Raphanus sativus]KAJ4874570.1 Uncharacterized protein Rs2_39588 [Raphanus sativus]